jgi:DNA-binding Xre family transcriptional regulator
MAIDYEWRLRLVMAERGMFKTTDLAPRLAEHGIHLSDSQIWRLVSGKPERLNLQVLMVLCEVLGCEPNDLIRRREVSATVPKRRGETAATLNRDLKPTAVRLRRPSD